VLGQGTRSTKYSGRCAAFDGAVVILDILQFRNDVGREFCGLVLAPRAIFLQIGALDQLALGAPHHLRRGQFAEQLEADLVVDADQQRTDRHRIGDAACDRLLETAVA
jgi:hypothetical protein